MIDPQRVVADFRAMYPEELVARYGAGERDFHSINLLRAELASLAKDINYYSYGPPTGGVRFGYWGHQVSPLWVDRQTHWEPIFHWDEDKFECLVEESWEDHEEWPEVTTKDLSGADLSEINLQGAYLYKVDLRKARLVRAQFQAAILVDVDLSGAALEYADFREARMISTRFVGTNLHMARLERASLQGADFSHADLSRAKLRRANLRSTIWKGTNISWARFSRNALIGADLRGLDLTNVNLADATVYGSLITPEQQESFLDALAIIRDADAPRPRYVRLPSR